MASPVLARSSLSVLAAVVALSSNLAHADEASPTVEEEAPSAPLTFFADVGYEFSNHDVLTGYVDSFVFGIPLRTPSARRRDFLDIGIAQLNTADSEALPMSYLVLGARSAWRWDRLGLSLFGHLRHGDTATDGDFTTASRSGSIGVIASVDVWRRKYLSLALGVHATGHIYEARDDGDLTAALGGSTGISIIAW